MTEENTFSFMCFFPQFESNPIFLTRVLIFSQILNPKMSINLHILRHFISWMMRFFNLVFWLSSDNLLKYFLLLLLPIRDSHFVSSSSFLNCSNITSQKKMMRKSLLSSLCKVHQRHFLIKIFGKNFCWWLRAIQIIRDTFLYFSDPPLRVTFLFCDHRFLCLICFKL